jgi:O-antigen ligase
VLLKLSRFFVCGALFSVLVMPLAAAYCAGYFFFRVAVESALACLVLWWGFAAPAGALRVRFGRIADDPVFRAVLLFALAFLAACLFAYDPKTAFWSNYQSGDGGFQMLHYLAFFSLLLLVFDTAKHWRLALALAVTATCLSIAYGILAAALVPSFVGYLGPDGTPIAPTFLGRLLATRFMGLHQNPGYLATALLFAIAFALYLAFTSRWQTVWAKLLWYAGLICLLLIFLVLSQTRGALLGLAIGAASFFAYLAFADARYRKRAAAGLLILAALLVTAFLARGSLTMPDAPGQRLLHLDVREDPVRKRLWAWNAAWLGFQERPVLGWGPENFDTVFDRHFEPRLYVASEPWEDRAHSIPFEYLAETGLVGLAAYAGIFAVLYWRLRRSLGHRRQGTAEKYPFSPYVPALFCAMPVAYLVQGLAYFDVLASYLSLFLFLALSAHWSRWPNSPDN